MTWAKQSGSAEKYQSREHRRGRAALVNLINAGELVECQAIVCVIGDRAITNTNGTERDGLHYGHHDDGVTYRGAEHRACNLHDAAVRANARSRGAQAVVVWVT